MKIVLAPNAFKECLTASQVSKAMKTGVLRGLSNFNLSHLKVEIIEIPLGDGGDGTTDCIVKLPTP